MWCMRALCGVFITKRTLCLCEARSSLSYALIHFYSFEVYEEVPRLVWVLPSKENSGDRGTYLLFLIYAPTYFVSYSISYPQICVESLWHSGRSRCGRLAAARAEVAKSVSEVPPRAVFGIYAFSILAAARRAPAVRPPGPEPNEGQTKSKQTSARRTNRPHSFTTTRQNVGEHGSQTPLRETAPVSHLTNTRQSCTGRGHPGVMCLSSRPGGGRESRGRVENTRRRMGHPVAPVTTPSRPPRHP